MAKDPTPRADALREQREARYGHLQATAEQTTVVIARSTAAPPPPKPARKRKKLKRKTS